MTVLDAVERKHTERMLPVLEEAIERLNEAYADLVTDRTIDAFGTDYVGEDDLKSIQNEPELVRIARVLDDLDKRVRKARADLADDGTNPPF